MADSPYLKYLTTFVMLKRIIRKCYPKGRVRGCPLSFACEILLFSAYSHTTKVVSNGYLLLFLPYLVKTKRSKVLLTPVENMKN